MNDKFIYGTQFYRPPAPPRAERKRDLQTLVDLNFDTIKCFGAWRLLNPAPDEYDFAETLEILDHAHRLGLKVIYCPTNELTPAWLHRQFPDAHYRNAAGHRVLPAWRIGCPMGGWPGMCFDHPAISEAEQKYVRALALAVGPHPALLLWNVAEEPQLPAGPCYCEHTIALYHQWLQKQYDGNLEKLNVAHHGTAYRHWEEVEPPRQSYKGGVPGQIDWRKFTNFWMADIIERRVNMIKAADPGDHPFMAHAGRAAIAFGLNSDIPGSGVRANDDWRLAEKVDIYGESIHPCFNYAEEFLPAHMRDDTRWRSESMWLNCMTLDQIRSAANGKPFWIAELQGGRSCDGLYRGPQVRPSDLRTWIFLGLSCGISGITYWQHRHESAGFEAFGFGLLEMDGSISERAAEAGRIAAMIKSHESFFLNARPSQAQIAIVVDQDAMHYLHAAEGSEAFIINSIAGIYRFFLQRNIRVDFLDGEQLRNGKLSQYELVVLPMPQVMRQTTAKAISEYVHAGGVLVSEALPALYDEHGRAFTEPPGWGMATLFGVTEKDASACGLTPWDNAIHEKDQPDFLEGIDGFSDCRMKICGWLQLLNVKTAKPIFLSGSESAAAVNEFGNGRAYVVGTFFGQSLRYHEDPGAAEFLSRILHGAGIEEDLNLNTPKGVLVRRLRDDSAEAIVIANSTSFPQQLTLNVPTGMTATDMLTEAPLKIDDGSITVNTPCFDSRMIVFSVNGKNTEKG